MPVQDYNELVDRYAAQYGLEPEQVRAVMQAESAGDPSALSPKGASGLMQIMPATFAEHGAQYGYSPDQINDPEANIHVGTSYLAQQVKEFGPEVGRAAYNAGPGAVRKHGGIPPYPETQDYVKKTALPGSAPPASSPSPTSSPSPAPGGAEPSSPKLKLVRAQAQELAERYRDWYGEQGSPVDELDMDNPDTIKALVNDTFKDLMKGRIRDKGLMKFTNDALSRYKRGGLYADASDVEDPDEKNEIMERGSRVREEFMEANPHFMGGGQREGMGGDKARAGALRAINIGYEAGAAQDESNPLARIGVGGVATGIEHSPATFVGYETESLRHVPLIGEDLAEAAGYAQQSLSPGEAAVAELPAQLISFRGYTKVMQGIHAMGRKVLEAGPQGLRSIADSAKNIRGAAKAWDDKAAKLNTFRADIKKMVRLLQQRLGTKPRPQDVRRYREAMRLQSYMLKEGAGAIRTFARGVEALPPGALFAGAEMAAFGEVGMMQPYQDVNAFSQELFGTNVYPQFMEGVRLPGSVAFPFAFGAGAEAMRGMRPGTAEGGAPGRRPSRLQRQIDEVYKKVDSQLKSAYQAPRIARSMPLSKKAMDNQEYKAWEAGVADAQELVAGARAAGDTTTRFADVYQESAPKPGRAAMEEMALDTYREFSMEYQGERAKKGEIRVRAQVDAEVKQQLLEGKLSWEDLFTSKRADVLAIKEGKTALADLADPMYRQLLRREAERNPGDLAISAERVLADAYDKLLRDHRKMIDNGTMVDVSAMEPATVRYLREQLNNPEPAIAEAAARQWLWTRLVDAQAKATAKPGKDNVDEAPNIFEGIKARDARTAKGLVDKAAEIMGSDKTPDGKLTEIQELLAKATGHKATAPDKVRAYEIAKQKLEELVQQLEAAPRADEATAAETARRERVGENVEPVRPVTEREGEPTAETTAPEDPFAASKSKADGTLNVESVPEKDIPTKDKPAAAPAPAKDPTAHSRTFSAAEVSEATVTARRKAASVGGGRTPMRNLASTLKVRMTTSKGYTGGDKMLAEFVADIERAVSGETADYGTARRHLDEAIKYMEAEAPTSPLLDRFKDTVEWMESQQGQLAADRASIEPTQHSTSAGLFRRARKLVTDHDFTAADLAREIKDGNLSLEQLELMRLDAREMQRDLMQWAKTANVEHEVRTRNLQGEATVEGTGAREYPAGDKKLTRAQVEEMVEVPAPTLPKLTPERLADLGYKDATPETIRALDEQRAKGLQTLMEQAVSRGRRARRESNIQRLRTKARDLKQRREEAVSDKVKKQLTDELKPVMAELYQAERAAPVGTGIRSTVADTGKVSKDARITYAELQLVDNLLNVKLKEMNKPLTDDMLQSAKAAVRLSLDYYGDVVDYRTTRGAIEKTGVTMQADNILSRGLEADVPLLEGRGGERLDVPGTRDDVPGIGAGRDLFLKARLADMILGERGKRATKDIETELDALTEETRAAKRAANAKVRTLQESEARKAAKGKYSELTQKRLKLLDEYKRAQKAAQRSPEKRTTILEKIKQVREDPQVSATVVRNEVQRLHQLVEELDLVTSRDRWEYGRVARPTPTMRNKKWNTEELAASAIGNHIITINGERIAMPGWDSGVPLDTMRTGNTINTPKGPLLIREIDHVELPRTNIDTALPAPGQLQTILNKIYPDPVFGIEHPALDGPRHAKKLLLPRGESTMVLVEAQKPEYINGVLHVDVRRVGKDGTPGEIESVEYSSLKNPDRILPHVESQLDSMLNMLPSPTLGTVLGFLQPPKTTNRGRPEQGDPWTGWRSPINEQVSAKITKILRERTPAEHAVPVGEVDIPSMRAGRDAARVERVTKYIDAWNKVQQDAWKQKRANIRMPDPDARVTTTYAPTALNQKMLEWSFMWGEAKTSQQRVLDVASSELGKMLEADVAQFADGTIPARFAHQNERASSAIQTLAGSIKKWNEQGRDPAVWHELVGYTDRTVLGAKQGGKGIMPLKEDMLAQLQGSLVEERMQRAGAVDDPYVEMAQQAHSGAGDVAAAADAGSRRQYQARVEVSQARETVSLAALKKAVGTVIEGLETGSLKGEKIRAHALEGLGVVRAAFDQGWEAHAQNGNRIYGNLLSALRKGGVKNVEAVMEQLDAIKDEGRRTAIDEEGRIIEQVADAKGKYSNVEQPNAFLNRYLEDTLTARPSREFAEKTAATKVEHEAPSYLPQQKTVMADLRNAASRFLSRNVMTKAKRRATPEAQAAVKAEFVEAINTLVFDTSSNQRYGRSIYRLLDRLTEMKGVDMSNRAEALKVFNIQHELGAKLRQLKDMGVEIPERVAYWAEATIGPSYYLSDVYKAQLGDAAPKVRTTMKPTPVKETPSAEKAETAEDVAVREKIEDIFPHTKAQPFKDPHHREVYEDTSASYSARMFELADALNSPRSTREDGAYNPRDHVQEVRMNLMLVAEAQGINAAQNVAKEIRPVFNSRHAESLDALRTLKALMEMVDKGKVKSDRVAKEFAAVGKRLQKGIESEQAPAQEAPTPERVQEDAGVVQKPPASEAAGKAPVSQDPKTSLVHPDVLIITDVQITGTKMRDVPQGTVVLVDRAGDIHIMPVEALKKYQDTMSPEKLAQEMGEFVEVNVHPKTYFEGKTFDQTTMPWFTDHATVVQKLRQRLEAHVRSTDLSDIPDE